MRPLQSLTTWCMITGLVLPSFAEKSPLNLRPSARNDDTVHRVHGGGDIRGRYHVSRGSDFTRNTPAANLRTSKRIEQPFSSEPELPEYSFEEVAVSETETRFFSGGDDPSVPQNNNRHAFDNTEPHVTEPDSDIDSIWSRHSPEDDAEMESDDAEPPDESHEEKLAHSPIVYQYFGRSRSRVHTADSIPFILLGPTADHWKMVGQTLASRGFSVMACEVAEETGNNKKRRNRKEEAPDEGKNLILAILDALKWNRAILVGCDSEAKLAIEAAIQLAPERVAGLVLCGDLSEADKLAQMATSTETEHYLSKSQRKQDYERHTALDTLLHNYLDCPYAMVWDGDVAHSPTSRSDSNTYSTTPGDMFEYNRCLILGGGTAPHRRVPEQFAWVLTRFVEEKVAPRSVRLKLQSGISTEDEMARKNKSFWRDHLPSGIRDVFSPGSMLVTGRIVASVILYVTAMKVAVYQYESFRGGVVSIHSLVQYVTTGRRRIFNSVGCFFKNYGYVSRLFVPLRPSKRREMSERIDSEETDNEEESESIQSDEDNGVEEEVETEVETSPVGEGDDAVDQDDLEEQEGNKETQDDGADDEEKPPRLMLLDLVVV